MSNCLSDRLYAAQERATETLEDFRVLAEDMEKRIAELEANLRLAEDAIEAAVEREQRALGRRGRAMSERLYRYWRVPADAESVLSLLRQRLDCRDITYEDHSSHKRIAHLEAICRKWSICDRCLEEPHDAEEPCPEAEGVRDE